jgi:ATP-dependent Clp protease adaptor protein ClpS
MVGSPNAWSRNERGFRTVGQGLVSLFIQNLGDPSRVEGGTMDSMKQPTVAPEIERESDVDEVVEGDRPWLVIVWNDPINLMTYVTYVFQKLFGYSYEKAHKLMLDVHYRGKAVVSSGPREKAEMDCFRLHGYGLWATLSKSE